jgi:AraC family transcriptional regulator
MFVQSFPDLQWLKNQAESRFTDRKAINGLSLEHTGWPTVILNVRASNVYRDNIPGPFSFFTTVSGNSLVKVDGRSTEIPSGCFFLTNAGQRYTLEIKKGKPAETFNIHFGEKWAEDVLISVNGKTDALLDRPDRGIDLNALFYNRLFLKDAMVNTVIRTIADSSEEGRLKEEELLYQLMVYLLKENYFIKESALQLPVIKSSSREEILKRLFRATDYIYAHYAEDISLDSLANISCLSRFHFLRLFKQVFRQTPHRFVTAVRMEKAKALLAHEKSEVKWVASSLGFSNAGSFSRLFHQYTGVYPSQFRAMN